MRIKKWTPIIVAWEDAVTYHEPARSDDNFPTAYRNSIGFLIRRNNRGVTVAMEDDRSADTGDDDCQTVTTIPLGMILSLTVLEPKDVVRLRGVRRSGKRAKAEAVKTEAVKTDGAAAVCPEPAQQ